MNEDKVTWYEQTPIVSGSRHYEREYPITMKQVLTLRDQFAMAALTAIIAQPQRYATQRQDAAKQAYEAADEMLAEREKKK